MGPFACGETWPVQDTLMNLNCTVELTLLAEQISKDEINLGRFGIGPRGLGELGNGSAAMPTMRVTRIARRVCSSMFISDARAE